MINLIIDATGDKIFFKIIGNDESYTSEHINSRENFDNFVVLLSEFLEKNKVKIENINKIFVNQGPGKFSSIHASISVVKGICIANKLNF
jgi:Inactive homolog of metal-dependent proteases, putative molecular chaperone